MSDPTQAAAGLAPAAVERAGVAEAPEAILVPPGGAAPAGDKPRSLGQDAFAQLRRNPIAIVATIFILLIVIMAIWPGLFTSKDPTDCQLLRGRQAPSASAWFGYDIQGCDVYARTIYGARASVLVGVLTTLATVFVGGFLGMIAAYYGGWLDSVLSRVTDVFFSIPLLLGSIIVLTSLPSPQVVKSMWGPLFKVVLGLVVLGWPSTMRIMRSTVLQVKEADYVHAAKAMGAGTPRILLRHILPNAVQPVIVVSTISLGAYIGAEATLSYLGIGLRTPAISWGIAINDAHGIGYLRVAPHMLLFPAAFLSLTVLAFIMLGDAVRDALDPKLR